MVLPQLCAEGQVGVTMSPKRLLMVICLLFFTAIAAQAQSVHGTIVGCISGCGSPGGSGGGSSVGSPSYTPSPAQQQQQRLYAQAQASNAQGNAAFARKDWATAANYYQAALQKTPGDVVIRHNLAGAQGWLGNEAYNRQDWKGAYDMFREAVRNNPNDPILAQWLKTAEEKYQVAEAENALRRQEVADAEKQQRENQIAAQGVQQVMRNFAQTLDGSSDLYRVGSAAAPNDGKKVQSATGSGDTGLQFLPPSTAPGNAQAATPPNEQAPATTVAPAAGRTAQSLEFMPPGEIHDAPVNTTTPTARAVSPAALQGASGGNLPPAGLPVTQNLAQPTAQLNTNFDGNDPGQTPGGDGDPLKFHGASVATSTQTATGQGQPVVQPQPKATNPEAQFAPQAVRTRAVPLNDPNVVDLSERKAPTVDVASIQGAKPGSPRGASSRGTEPPPPDAQQQADIQRLFDDPRREHYEFQEALVASDKEFGTWTAEDERMKAEADEFLANWARWTAYAMEKGRAKELLDIRANSNATAVACDQIQQKEQAAVATAHARTTAAIAALMRRLKEQGLYKPGASLEDNAKNTPLVQAVKQGSGKLLAEENQAIRDAEAEARKELLEAGHQIITLGKPWSLNQRQ